MLMLCSPGLCGAKKSNPVQRDRDGDDLLLMDLARVHKNPFFCRKMLMLMMMLMMASSMMVMMTSQSSLQQCIESLPVEL